MCNFLIGPDAGLLRDPEWGWPNNKTTLNIFCSSELGQKIHRVFFLWGEQDSNLRRFPNGFTVRPRWPLEYLPGRRKYRQNTCCGNNFFENRKPLNLFGLAILFYCRGFFKQELLDFFT